MTVINTNTSAVIAANSLAKNERAMNEAMERLSTGKRINNAGDDAAGAAISDRMLAKVVISKSPTAGSLLPAVKAGRSAGVSKQAQANQLRIAFLAKGNWLPCLDTSTQTRCAQSS